MIKPFFKLGTVLYVLNDNRDPYFQIFVIEKIVIAEITTIPDSDSEKVTISYQNKQGRTFSEEYILGNGANEFTLDRNAAISYHNKRTILFQEANAKNFNNIKKPNKRQIKRGNKECTILTIAELMKSSPAFIKKVENTKR